MVEYRPRSKTQSCGKLPEAYMANSSKLRRSKAVAVAEMIYGAEALNLEAIVG